MSLILPRRRFLAGLAAAFAAPAIVRAESLMPVKSLASCSWEAGTARFPDVTTYTFESQEIGTAGATRYFVFGRGLAAVFIGGKPGIPVPGCPGCFMEATDH